MKEYFWGTNCKSTLLRAPTVSLWILGKDKAMDAFSMLHLRIICSLRFPPTFLACFETIPYQAIQAVTFLFNPLSLEASPATFFEMSPLLGVQRIARHCWCSFFGTLNQWLIKVGLRPSFLGGCVRGGLCWLAIIWGPWTVAQILSI